MSEIKREIEVKEFECPFCGSVQSELVRDEMLNEETGEVMGFGIDGWECKKCGAENDIGLEEFKKDYKPFKEFIDENDWDGLHQYCKYNTSDDFFMLTNLAKLYNQQRKFRKALDLAAVILVLDPTNPDLEFIIRNAKKSIKNKREIK